jgi:hypothetical protein
MSDSDGPDWLYEFSFALAIGFELGIRLRMLMLFRARTMFWARTTLFSRSQIPSSSALLRFVGPEEGREMYGVGSGGP